MAQGIDGLLRDKTRPARIAALPVAVRDRAVALTLSNPPGETTHWTAGLAAEQLGISVSSVQRIWRAHGLQPHRVRQFKLSRDRQFVEKLRDVVGLYVDPPAHAVVLSVDEKSQIQALDRTQPSLPMKKGRCGTMTHDYKRHGTTTLFAATQRAGRKDHRPLHTAPPPSGVYPLSQHHRSRHPGRQDNPRRPRQLRYAQAPQGARLARPAPTVSLSFHADLGLLAQCHRGLLRQAGP